MTATFTARELDLMAVLWEHGPSTVAEVRARLADPLSHNTVATLFTILENKGHVDHVEEGRAFRYRARVARDDAARSALSRVTDAVFGGSAESLLLHFVRDRRLSPDELARVRAALDERIEAAKPRRGAKPRNRP
jgi:predicted transcriptional regulator